MSAKHLDEAWRAAREAMRGWLGRQDEALVPRAVLALDLFGRIRAILWVEGGARAHPQDELASELERAAAPWWSGELWLSRAGDEDPVHELAWEEARPDPELPARLRLLERHRSRGAWFTDLKTPVWQPRGSDQPEGPPVVVFYSFKGGVGRSTALASFAIQRARLGERVAVLDFDLEAPGVGLLLAADAEGRTAPWGLLDYLLERSAPAPLADYCHRCARSELVGEDGGELWVFPAARLDEDYPGKLARVDLEPRRGGEGDPLASLLRSIRDELAPDWILLDARTGLSEPSGALLSGLAHLHVLFGTSSEQSWQGLRAVVERLGARRLARGLPQADCLLVQAMLPADALTAKMAQEGFEARALEEFSELYYAERSDEDWDLSDVEADDAPHRPVPLSYDLKLAHFRDIAEVAEELAGSPEYRRLAERIASRFLEASDG